MPSDLHLAARLTGEAAILATVATNQNDDTAKLVYADWLEEHDDPRGSFLRKFVSAVQKGSELPAQPDDSDERMAGWLELMGFALSTQIRDLGLGKHRSAIMALAKPAVALVTHTPCPEKKLRIGATKFGGLPSLPRGTEWPRCEGGPLQFLAQFDLAEVHQTLAGRALPPSGLLSFFMYHNYPDDEYGDAESGRGVPGGLRIIYTPGNADLLPLGAPDDLSSDLGSPHDPCRLTLSDALDIPRLEREQRTQYALEIGKKWWDLDLNSPLLERADHQLFGHSRVTVLVADPTPGPDWEQLLRFNSDDKLEWGWGDGHRLFWYIRSADLKERRFDNTAAIDG
jgi:uncharacterized protein (TIGR02996 family)